MSSTEPLTEPAATPQPSKKARRRAAASSLVGTSIEWYDYYLYGTAAALVFPTVFFPEDEGVTAVIKAFATYAVGFAARPIGGFVFGHFGDRIGRKQMLMISLLLMGAATFLIGVLPGEAQVGIWAPIMLIVLRLIQGFAVGGEWGSAVVMSVEFAPPGKRGLYGSFPQMGVPIGLLLSTGVFALFQAGLGPEEFLAWGWRVPFLLSGVLVLVGLFVRLAVTESPVFAAAKEADALAARPSAEVLKKEWRILGLAVGSKFFQNAVFYLYSVFLLSYISTTLRFDPLWGTLAVVISSAIGFISVPGWSWLTDKIGRKPVYLGGIVLGAAFYPFSWSLVESGSFVFLTIAMVIGLNLLHDMIYGPQAVYFAELFATRVRLSGASIAYQIGAMLSGGFAPLIATALLAFGGGDTTLITLYALGLAAISAVCTILLPETFKGSLRS
jgi:MHS family shikimate/dehydroshikimate transporter-like MFS transporter